jgi:primosomal protein N' (replication factor Y)
VAPERRWVAVAVDAAGVPGGRCFTYHVPAALHDLATGEAVIVDYGRQRVVGVVLADAAAPGLASTKPVLDRVRSDGPLLPSVTARLVARVAERYLAPPGLVVRAALPPGALESTALYAVAVDAAGTPGPSREGAEAALLERIRAAGPAGIAVEDLPAEPSRATRGRRLRTLQGAGRIALEWRLRPPEAIPRTERRAALTEAGRGAAHLLVEGGALPGRPLGPRQVALLMELGSSGAPADVAAARLADRHGASAVTSLARRGMLSLTVGVVERRPLEGRAVPARGALPEGAGFTVEQVAVAGRIAAATRERAPLRLLLEGVTASGKTAVYVAAVRSALEAGRGAIVLVPEIALALPLVDRLRHDLASDPIVLHSGLGEGQRADEWRRLRADPAPVVVGTRMAVLAPIADPGVIVVDEEHDAAYKSDRTPRLHARDVALELGALAGCPVVLGSATPDIVSIGRARAGELEHVRLAERAVGRPALVEVVDLRQELAEGNRGLLSDRLAAALAALDRAAGDQAVLVIDRRGSASVVLCRDCGHVQVCPDCQRPLVFHANVMALRCHHCGATAPVARRCPACGSARIRYLGGGTQRVEQEIHQRFPALRVGRLDRDVVERRGEAARVVDAFTDGRLDVLVGTRLVAKGLDVPRVTLVGIVSADVALALPDERAAERTWQLLTQAIGRAGRGDRPGLAIVQTYLPEHPAIRAVAEGDPAAFVEAELAERRRYGSPPFGRLVKLTAALADRLAAEATARELASTLRTRAAERGLPVEVLGPVPAYVARRAGRWRFHVVLRGPDPAALLGGDPGPPWSVDVDPESLL